VRIHAELDADPSMELVTPTEHGLGAIEAVHDPRLVAHLARAWELVESTHANAPDDGAAPAQVVPDTFLVPAMREGMGPAPYPTGGVASLGAWVFDTATPLLEGTYFAARVAVDVALTALDHVLAGAPVAYGLCRPPGHHAARRLYGGYCYFNNAAVAAQAAIAAGAGRVAVLDVDYHHGNGTQQLFYDRGDVLYVSVHADPNRAFPYFAGHADETGTGAGLGATLNLPLAEGVDDDAYLDVLDRALATVDGFDPNVLVVSLGVDTYRLDPIADFQITTEGFTAQGRRIGALGRPTVVVQEGGYCVEDLGRNVHAFLDGLRAMAT
jgi:acetoin utilization deacetylase AcuC-like enzyme